MLRGRKPQGSNLFKSHLYVFPTMILAESHPNKTPISVKCSVRSTSCCKTHVHYFFLSWPSFHFINCEIKAFSLLQSIDVNCKQSQKKAEALEFMFVCLFAFFLLKTFTFFRFFCFLRIRILQENKIQSHVLLLCVLW